MHLAANLLARKYEELSGKPFTFYADKQHDGTANWLTDGTEFVARGLQAIYPDAARAQLITAMRDKGTRTKNLQKRPS